MKNWNTWTLSALMLAGGLAYGADQPELKDTREKASYGIGANLGTGLKRDGVDVDINLLWQGFQDAYAGKELTMDEAAIRSTLQTYWQETRTKQGEVNLAAGKAFLEENKSKPGVVTLPSGLQYKVLTEGQGASPSAADRVKVHYRGTLLDGTQFDSSYDRGTPQEFRADQVIRGWTEALELMKVGSKWQLFIPSDLAYGPSGRGRNIPPNATLLFDVELLEIMAPPAPQQQSAASNTPPRVVTSDIIRVPSKEEMDKGAKIEVLKKEDVDKLLQEQKAAEKDK